MVILLLEDQPSVMGLMRAALQPLGHTLLEANNAEEAFARLSEAGAISLLIADVTLPGTSGIRVALELRSLLPKLGIIITSGYPRPMWNQSDAAELEKLPPHAFALLRKPFMIAALQEAVSRFIPAPESIAPKMMAAANGT